MEKLKNSHKGGVVRKFRTRGGVVRIWHNTRTTQGVVRIFRTRHYSPALCKFETRSNGENFWLLRVGNAG